MFPLFCLSIEINDTFYEFLSNQLQLYFVGVEVWEIAKYFGLHVIVSPISPSKKKKNVHKVINETCEEGTFCGKSDFADIFKVMDF